MSSLNISANGSRLISDTSKYVTSTVNAYEDEYINDYGLVKGLNNLSSFVSYCSDNLVKITPLWTKDYREFYSNQYSAFLQTAGFYSSNKFPIQRFERETDSAIVLNLDHYSEKFSGVNCYVTKINGVPIASDQSIVVTDSFSGVQIGTLEYTLNSNNILYIPLFNNLQRNKSSSLITIEITGTNNFDPALPLVISTLDFYLGYNHQLSWNDTLYCTNLHNKGSLEVNKDKWYFTPHVILEVTSENSNSLDLKDTIEILYNVCPSTLVINKLYYNGNLINLSDLYKKSTEFEKWIISKSILGGSSPVNAGDPLSTILY